MKNPAIVLALAAAVLLAACDGQTSSSSSSPSSWRDRLAKGDAEAVESLAKMGASGLPILMPLLKDESELVVQCAAMALGEMGEQAAPAVPALMTALKRFPGQMYVAQTLKGLKGAAIPAMVEALQSKDLEYKKAVAKLVGLMGTSAEPALQPLIAILEGSDPDPVKLEAIGSVAAISVKTVRGDALEVLKKIHAAGGDLAVYADRAIRRIEHKIKLEAKYAAEEGR